MFNILVWLGRLFMASLYLLMVVIMIPFAGIFELFDRAARIKSERASKEFVD
jgi:hypothetical protein